MSASKSERALERPYSARGSNILTFSDWNDFKIVPRNVNVKVGSERTSNLAKHYLIIYTAISICSLFIYCTFCHLTKLAYFRF